MSQLHVFDLDISPCPLCETHLTAASEEWRADQRCERCGGVWISAQRLEREFETAGSLPKFDAEYPSANFCPVCGPVPLDQGSLSGRRGLCCGSCQGVFLYEPLSTHSTRPTQPVRSTQPVEDASSSSSLNSSSIDASSAEVADPVKINESKSQSETVESAQLDGRSELSASSSRPESREASRLTDLSDHPADLIEISQVSTLPTEGSAQPESEESIKLDPSVDLNLIRDIVWFGSLVSVIGGSLWYWMTP